MPLINKASIKEQGFQINGDHYKIIVPESIDDLVAAMQIKDMLETELEKHEPDEGHPYYHFLKLQNAVIDDYLSCLGEFDNSIMAKNILFLSKKRGIGMGVLERIILINSTPSNHQWPYNSVSNDTIQRPCLPPLAIL